TRAVRAGTIYRREMVGGSPSWVVESSPVQTLTGLSATATPSNPDIGNTETGWQRQSACQMVRDGKRRWLHLVSRKGGSNIRSDSTTGGVFDQHLAGLHSVDRPPTEVAAIVTVRNPSGGTWWGGGRISSGGAVYLTSWAPNIIVGPASPDQAVILDATWWVS
ncbi:hypothetical protein, partial [Myceligenerans halotolerans]